MPDLAKLEALKRAALADDWKTAADVYLELALEAKGKPESVKVEALGPLLACLTARGWPQRRTRVRRDLRSVMIIES